MSVSKTFGYLLAVLLTLGLSAPLALAREKARNATARRATTGAALGREESTEKKGIEGREEKAAHRHKAAKGREESAEKKGIEGREEKAAHRHHKAGHRSLARRTHQPGRVAPRSG